MSLRHSSKMCTGIHTHLSITCHTQVSSSAHEEAWEGQLTGVVPNVILCHFLDGKSVSRLQYTWPPLPLTALLLTRKSTRASEWASERERRENTINLSSINRPMTARRQTHSTLPCTTLFVAPGQAGWSPGYQGMKRPCSCPVRPSPCSAVWSYNRPLCHYQPQADSWTPSCRTSSSCYSQRETHFTLNYTLLHIWGFPLHEYMRNG